MNDDNPTRVTLRETYSGFANIPNGWHVLGVGVMPKHEDEDDGTGRDVVVLLPDGLHVAEAGLGNLEFFGSGDFCLMLRAGRYEGQPVLLDDRGYVALKVARSEP